MSLVNVLIIVVSVLAAMGALGVVFSSQPIYSALSLVFCIGMVAVIYLILNAQFLFVVQLIVYAGAVMVLFVFIIALLSPSSEDRPAFGVRFIIACLAVVAITGTVFVTARNGVTYSGDTLRGAVVGRADSATDPAYARNAFDFSVDNIDGTPGHEGPGNVQTTGGQLFTTFLLPFEITSLLLLVAAIGAVYLTRRTPAGGH